MNEIKVTTIEIEDGSYYKGAIEFGEARFEYSLTNLRWDQMDEIPDLTPDQFLSLCSIYVSANGERMDLSECEQELLIAFSAKTARDLFYSPQRCSNRLGGGDGKIGKIGTNVIDLLAREGSYAGCGYTNEKSHVGLEQTLPLDLQHPVVQGLMEKHRNSKK